MLSGPAYLHESEPEDQVKRLLWASYDSRDIQSLDILTTQQDLLRICTQESLREKACSLVGASAARLSDVIHHVLNLLLYHYKTHQRHISTVPCSCSPPLLGRYTSFAAGYLLKIWRTSKQLLA